MPAGASRSKFIDTFDANLSQYNIRVRSGKYEGMLFRFSGTQSGATPPSVADFGRILLTYHGKQKVLADFTEIQAMNAMHYGAVEAVASVNDTDPFSYSFYLPFTHRADDENIFWIEDEKACQIQWQPLSTLAARVGASASCRVTGFEREGVMKYILGMNRLDVTTVNGVQTPQDITPYSVASLFIEYNTTNTYLTVTADGETVVENMQPIELLNFSTLKNRLETYAASSGTTYFEIDFISTRDPKLEGLTNNVQAIFTGSGAATVSMAWQYFDFQATELNKTRILRDQNKSVQEARKVSAGGGSALAALSQI